MLSPKHTTWRGLPSSKKSYNTYAYMHTMIQHICLLGVQKGPQKEPQDLSTTSDLDTRTNWTKTNQAQNIRTAPIATPPPPQFQPPDRPPLIFDPPA